MGMITEYVRLPPEQLARLLDDPEPGWDRVEELVDFDRTRHLDIHKSWDAIGFVLRRADLPVDVVGGGQDIEDADDWEYGPPRRLSPSEVRRAADALAATDIDALISAVDPAELTAERVYPQIWDEPDVLDDVRHHLRDLAAFLAAAAQDGDAVVVWLS